MTHCSTIPGTGRSWPTASQGSVSESPLPAGLGASQAHDGWEEVAREGGGRLGREMEMGEGERTPYGKAAVGVPALLPLQLSVGP